ncbi:hypothetical protein DK412_29635 [Methylobacterium sp. 17Sr1-1]|nr:hypothetical protein DK412_29635 [Methylobacterium sp. 17Sr1-1]
MPEARFIGGSLFDRRSTCCTQSSMSAWVGGGSASPLAGILAPGPPGFLDVRPAAGQEAGVGPLGRTGVLARRLPVLAAFPVHGWA